jgi:hypothetical protein
VDEVLCECGCCGVVWGCVVFGVPPLIELRRWGNRKPHEKYLPLSSSSPTLFSPSLLLLLTFYINKRGERPELATCNPTTRTQTPQPATLQPHNPNPTHRYPSPPVSVLVCCVGVLCGWCLCGRCLCEGVCVGVFVWVCCDVSGVCGVCDVVWYEGVVWVFVVWCSVVWCGGVVWVCDV